MHLRGTQAFQFIRIVSPRERLGQGGGVTGEVLGHQHELADVRCVVTRTVDHVSGVVWMPARCSEENELDIVTLLRDSTTIGNSEAEATSHDGVAPV